MLPSSTGNHLNDAGNHVLRLQVFPFKCLSAPWYIKNRQMHEDLDVPSFADLIRALTASFRAKLMWGTPWYGNWADKLTEG